MGTPVLSIVIPTFNRAGCLSVLVDLLVTELTGLEDRVSVVVGDNASTDDTPQVTSRLAQQYRGATILRHERNVGPEENFSLCIEATSAEYLWLIGDDDVPRVGFVRLLLDLLARVEPDLVHVQSRWLASITAADAGPPLAQLDSRLLDRASFARTVHVWTTFISGTIVRRRYADAPSLRRFTNTSLVQLGWVYGALAQGTRFIAIRTPAILATQGNTGGYRVLQVFGANFPRITREALSGTSELDRVAGSIIWRAALAYLPNLVFEHRSGRLGRFDTAERLDDVIGDEVRQTFLYRWLIRPIEQLPLSVASVLLRVCRVGSRAVRFCDRVRSREPVGMATR